MTYIPPGECEVWLGFQVAGDSEIMYTHLGYDMTVTPITQALVDAGFTQFQTSFRPRWNLDMTLTGGHVIVGPSGVTSRWDSSIGTVPGTGAGALLPNNCSVLVRKTTLLGGRAGRGRMYFPCPAEAETSPAGVYSSAAITAWNTSLATLMPGGAVHTAFGFLDTPRLFHSQPPLPAPPTNPPSTIITDLGALPKIATQRRRMRP